MLFVQFFTVRAWYDVPGTYGTTTNKVDDSTAVRTYYVTVLVNALLAQSIHT